MTRLTLVMFEEHHSDPIQVHGDHGRDDRERDQEAVISVFAHRVEDLDQQGTEMLLEDIPKLLKNE